jgi:hypothetical protein
MMKKPLLLLALAVALTQGASVSASWEASVAGVNITVTYAAEVEVSTDKTWVLLPGEEVELRCRASGGNLTLQLVFPGLGGGSWRHKIPLNPGEVYRAEFEAAPGVKLRVYVVVKITAQVAASGAEPHLLKTELPCAARFKTGGSARFSVTFYAVPVVGVEVEGLGVAVTLFEREMAEAPMAPSLSAEVYSIAPVLALVVAAVVTSAVLLRRRASRKNAK